MAATFGRQLRAGHIRGVAPANASADGIGLLPGIPQGIPLVEKAWFSKPTLASTTSETNRTLATEGSGDPGPCEKDLREEWPVPSG